MSTTWSDNTNYDGESYFEESSETENTESLSRYVAFISNGLTYVINASCVTEIITNHSIRKLPMVPSYIPGIINLRGQIIPIVDVRRRMGNYYPSDESSKRQNCIIVINIQAMEIGIIVDTVTKTLDISEAAIAPMPPNNRQELVNGIQTTPDGETVLFFDHEMLVNTL